MEHPGAKKGQYLTLLMLALLFGYLLPLIGWVFSNETFRKMMAMDAKAPGIFFTLLIAMPVLSTGILAFAAMRFRMIKCLPFLAVPLALSATEMILVRITVPAVSNWSQTLVYFFAFEPLTIAQGIIFIYLCPMLLHKAKKEITAVALVLLIDVGMSFVYREAISIVNYFTVDGAGAAAYWTPAKLFFNWIPRWCLTELWHTALSLLAYFALLYLYDRRENLRNSIVKLGRMLIHAWDAIGQ